MAKDKNELPNNREAEEAVLGAVLINPDIFSTLQAILKPEDFYIDRHGWIWQAYNNLAKQGQPIDYLTVATQLEGAKLLEEIGGNVYLTTLYNQTPTSLHAEAYANIVRQQAFRREAIQIGSQIASIAYNQEKNIDSIAECLLEGSQKALGSPQGRYFVRNVEYALQPSQPIKYLLEGLIYEKSITVLYGDGGTKKTWSSIYLGVCISAGIAWGDIQTEKTRVLFIDEENGDAEIKNRIGFSIRGALAENLADLTFISLAAFHLDNPQDEAILTREICTQGAGLVIFDALADLMLGDENSKQDTQPVFNALRRITEKTGAAIIVIHHAKKDGGGYRGSSVIKDAPDLVIKVESDPDSNFINFRTEKNRKGKSRKWSMYATWNEAQFYLGHTEEPRAQLSDGEKFIIEYLKENGEKEKIEIQDAVEIASQGSNKAAEKYLYSLEKRGLIKRTNPSENKKIRAKYISVPPEEQNA